MYNPYDDPYSGDSSGGHHIHVEYKRNNVFKRKKEGSATINAGGAIIIIIFVVLCLTIFGLLSFTTAFADKKLADRTLNNVREYYIADTKAEKMLADIYSGVHDKIGAFSTGQSFADFVRSVLELPDLEISEFAGGEAAVVSYTTQMNDVQALHSSIILFYDNNKLSYKISQWNIILTAEFDYSDSGADIWDGGGFFIDFE